MVINEKHELTLSFTSSDELWKFAKKYQDKIKTVTDYNYCKWEVIDNSNNDLIKKEK